LPVSETPRWEWMTIDGMADTAAAALAIARAWVSGTL
jgi:hypothetical protein